MVAGNVPVDRAARNALVVRDWADRPEIPVYAGCRRPLVRELTTAESVHGKNGLDGVPLHEPQAGVSTGHAVDFLINTLRSSPEGSVTLCLIGPSTNFAAAVIQARCRSPNQGNRHDGRLLLHAGKRDASGGVQCVC